MSIITTLKRKDRKMKLSEHFGELKRRIIYSIVIFLIIFSISYLNITTILQYILKPLYENNVKELIYTNISDVFVLNLNLALICGFIFTIPFFMLQIYLFLSISLRKHERTTIITIFISFLTMFAFGLSILYIAILPNAIQFLVNYNNIYNNQLLLLPNISEYLNDFLKLSIGFGLAFQFPLIIWLLVKIDLLQIKVLENKRRMMIVIIFIIAAIVTPPDILSQIIFAIIMFIIYELTIVVCKLTIKQNKRLNHRKNI